MLSRQPNTHAHTRNHILYTHRASYSQALWLPPAAPTCPLMASHSCHIKHLVRHSGSRDTIFLHRQANSPHTVEKHRCMFVGGNLIQQSNPLPIPISLMNIHEPKHKTSGSERPTVWSARLALINIDPWSVSACVCTYAMLCVCVCHSLPSAAVRCDPWLGVSQPVQ